MAGQILGDRYQVERQLGKQTGRWTLLTRDLQTQERVVIKLLFVDEQLEWDDRKLFEREVEILKSLSHPCIPRYIGYFEQQLPNARALALIQTYVEGLSLEQCLKKGRLFNEAEAKQIAKGILNILSYLHGRQPPIVHRDIKPSNILLANRQLYMVDFGSVKQVSNAESTAFTVVGTYGYMPPEQFSGRAIPPSDLYSLAATILAMITGSHPSSLPRAGTRVDFSKIPQISPTFADWLGWLYEPSLDRRAKTVQEALNALEHGRETAVTNQTAIAPVPKPPDTKITLTKDPTFLEVIIPSRMGHTQLQIDQTQIMLTSKTLGLSSGRPQTAARKDITRLTYQKPSSATASDPEAHIMIWTAQQKFQLKGSQATSKAELDWLAYELSTWLQLPIS